MNTNQSELEGFYLGGQLAYVLKGTSGTYVHDDMGQAVMLRPVPQYNWIEFAIDCVVIKSGVGH